MVDHGCAPLHQAKWLTRAGLRPGGARAVGEQAAGGRGGPAKQAMDGVQAEVVEVAIWRQGAALPQTRLCPAPSCGRQAEGPARADEVSE